MKATNKNAKVKISRKNLMIKNKNELNKKNKSQIYEPYIKVNKKKIYTPKKRISKNISNNKFFSKTISPSCPKFKKPMQILDKESSKKEIESELQKEKEDSKIYIDNSNDSIYNTIKTNNDINKINKGKEGNDDSINFIREKNETLNEINNILNQDKLSDEQIIENIKILLYDYPAINKFDKVKTELLTKDDFEIFDDEKNDNNFLFKVNSYNIISIINLLWEQSNKSSTDFINYLTKLNIYFSYIKNKEASSIDFAILTPISNNLYNYISSYGKYIFKDKSFFESAKSFITFSEEKKYDEFYYLENININKLIYSIGETNCNILPNVLYYIKEKTALKLIELKIINAPIKYKFHDSKKDIKQNQGYNSFDLIIYMNKTINIKESGNFKSIVNCSFQLLKGNFYFFEFKNEICDEIKTKSRAKDALEQFQDSFKNVEITCGIKFDMDNSHLISVYDEKYYRKKNRIKENDFKENISFSNSHFGLHSLILLDKRIKYLIQNVELIQKEIFKHNKILEQQKNDFNIKLQQQNDDFNTKLELQKNDFNSKLERQKNDFNAKLEQQNNDFYTKLEQQKNDFNTKFKRFKEEMDKKFEEQNKYLDNLIKRYLQISKENELEIIQHEYETYKNMLSLIDYPIEIKNLLLMKNFEINFDFEKCGKCYDVFLKMTKSFLTIREKDNLFCYRINKYIEQHIIKKEEKNEWIDLKKEFNKKFNNANFKDYYEGLFLLLYRKGYKIRENCGLIKIDKNTARFYIKNLINFLSIFEENYYCNIDDIEIKFQTAIIYIAYKLRGAKYISNKFKIIKQSFIKSEVKIIIISEIRKLMKELISGITAAK